MSRLSIVFQGGVNEIGGNKILIHDVDAGIKIYFDFGKSFSVSRKYYEFPFTYPESIEELISIGAVPENPSIYTRFKKEDFRKGVKKELDRETDIDAVFVSHAHLDHYGHITLLNRRIPIYLGACAYNIIIGGKSLIYSRVSPELFYEGLEFNLFRTGDIIEFNKRGRGIEIQPIHVDHSVPGAYGFIARTSGGVVAYTGDFRIHGPHKEMTYDFIRALEKEGVDVLIVEGTHINYSSSLSEKDVYEKMLEVIDRARRNLVIVDFSRSDLDRFSTIYRVALHMGRTLVIDAKRYKILKSILQSGNIRDNLIDLRSESILVLDEGKKRLSFGEREVFEEISEDKKITFSEIKKEPEKYIFTVVFGGIREIRSLKPPAGSIFILSSSEPVNEEREISFDKLMNWLEHFGIASYHIHSSGHATPLDIRLLVERTDPKIVVPIHTEHPLLFKNFIGRRNTFIPMSNGARLDVD